MSVSSTRLRGIFGDEQLKRVMPPALDLGPAGGTRRGGAAVRELEGAGEVRYVLSVDTDSEMRDRTVRAGSLLQ